MDLVENRFGKTWKHFLEVLKVDYNCSLADVCRDQHTTFGGMSSWMSRRGYSVKQAKADVVRDYYGGVEPSQLTTSSPSFTQIAPAMLSEEEFSLAGITITFNSGTTISVKRATPGGVIKMLRDYERKEGDANGQKNASKYDDYPVSELPCTKVAIAADANGPKSTIYLY